MPTITRRFEWDAAHRVLGHEGKCRHLHGHRYAAEVTVSAPSLDPLGRVIDFSVLKERVGGWINENWDHNIILHPDDPLLTVGDLSADGARETERAIFAGKEPFTLPNLYGNHTRNPTAENIAAYLAWRVSGLLPGLKVVRVRVWETPNCYADYPDPL